MLRKKFDGMGGKKAHGNKSSKGNACNEEQIP